MKLLIEKGVFTDAEFKAKTPDYSMPRGATSSKGKRRSGQPVSRFVITCGSDARETTPYQLHPNPIGTYGLSGQLGFRLVRSWGASVALNQIENQRTIKN